MENLNDHRFLRKLGNPALEYFDDGTTVVVPMFGFINDDPIHSVPDLFIKITFDAPDINPFHDLHDDILFS